MAKKHKSHNPGGKHSGKKRGPKSPNPGPYKLPVEKRYYDLLLQDVNLLADWWAPQTTGDTEILAALTRTRNYARDMERNNDVMRCFLRELEQNVVGPTGFRYQSKLKMQKRPKLDTDMNQALEGEWEEFCRRGVYDVTGRLSAVAADKAILRRIATDGEVIIRKIRGFPNKWGFAIQILESDALDFYYNVGELPNGNCVRFGVELDKWFRPVAYHLLNHNPGDLVMTDNLGTYRTRVPADQVLHFFVCERLTAQRGIPWITAAMLKMRMTDKYGESEAIAARATSAKMGFLESEQGAEEYEGQGEDKQGNKISEFQPGMIEELPMGKKFVPFNPGSPSTQYPDFRKAMLRGIGSGIGMSYARLGNDLEAVNFSSGRLGQLSENDFFRGIQGLIFVEYVKPEIHKGWLEMALLKNAIPGGTMTRYDDYVAAARFNPRGFSPADLLKENQALALEFGMLINSPRRVCTARGIDFDELVDEIAADLEMLEEKGLEISLTTPVPASEPEEPPPAPNGDGKKPQTQPQPDPPPGRSMNFVIRRKRKLVPA
jgi:lambda family phage portal protein